MDAFLKVYLPIFFIAFLMLVFVVPSVRVYKQTGINPFRFITKHNTAHDFVGATMKVFIGILLLVIIIHTFFPHFYYLLAPFEYLEISGLKITGLIIGHLSLLAIMLAQIQMRQSWRIGIDYENKTSLITNGFFRLTRNPIYLFLLVCLTGLFLIIPNGITFAVLFAAYLILQVTMRLEEEFLHKQHGEEYLAYKRKVRRLL